MFSAMMAGVQDNFVRTSRTSKSSPTTAPQQANASGIRRPRARCRARRRSGAAAGHPLEEPVGDGMDGDGVAAARRPRIAERPGGRGAAAGARREDAGSQRAVLLRQRQEVQALPRSLNRPPAPSRCATSPRILADLRRRVDDAPRISGSTRPEPVGRARAGGEPARPLGRPGPGAQGHDRARRSSRRPRRSYGSERLSEIETLFELGREEGDDSVEPEIDVGGTALVRRPRQARARALFTGEHDERDAICEVHSGAGGTDAQDWTEMLLRMYMRWAERRGFEVELDEVSPRARKPASSATFIVKGRYRVRACLHGEGRAPPDSHLAVRRQRASPDGVRGVRRGSRPRRRPRSPTSIPATCASTRTARRARAASTSTSRTPPCASRTCRRASSCRARTSARRSRTRRKAMQILAARLAERQREERQPSSSALGREARRRLRQSDPHLHAGAVSTGEGRAHPLRDRQRPSRARRRSRPVHRGVPPVAPAAHGGAVEVGRRMLKREGCRTLRALKLTSAARALLLLRPFSSMIRFENVTKIYKGDVVAFRDVSVEVQKGEFVFLVGPSGSGKSTRLRLLLREENSTTGRIIVAGRDISRLSSLEGPATAPQHRLRLPGLQAPAQQDRLRERRLRDGRSSGGPGT